MELRVANPNPHSTQEETEAQDGLMTRGIESQAGKTCPQDGWLKLSEPCQLETVVAYTYY